ncbi:hypothetical protein WA577_005376, partial [Blastocystis sp. JDR]
MESKFNSYVEAFYVSLSDEEFDKARSQLDAMKKWYTAYLRCIDGLEGSPSVTKMKKNQPLLQQMIDHCGKRLTEATFKKYHEYIKNMKCFPPDFWEICEKNQLENTVVAFFNHDAVLQMRALIEECSHREIEAADSLQRIDGMKTDISGFIVEDLSGFCTCSNYIVHVLSVCQQSPYRSSLDAMITQVRSLLISGYNTFQQCISSLDSFKHCKLLIERWKAFLLTAERDCENAAFSEEPFLGGEELQQMAALLSMLTTFLHSLHAVESADHPDFASSAAAFADLDTAYTQICMYSLLQSNHQTSFPISPALAEDAFFLLRESARRQVLVAQPLTLSFSLLLSFLAAASRAVPAAAPSAAPAGWLQVDDRTLVGFDGLALASQYLLEMNSSFPGAVPANVSTSLQDLLASLQHRLLAAAQPAVAAAATSDWAWRSFALSPKDYDAAVREPIAFPSIARLACGELT